jgi:hypothetical protein
MRSREFLMDQVTPDRGKLRIDEVPESNLALLERRSIRRRR